MAPRNSLGDIRSLALLARNTQDKARDVCGIHNELTLEARNLHQVLQRLEQEATKDHSPLQQNGDVRTMELKAVSGKCEKALEDIIRFLRTLAPKDINPLSNPKKVDFHRFQSDLNDFTSRLSYITVKVSADYLAYEKEEIDGDGEFHALRFGVTRIASRLMATGDISNLALAKNPTSDGALWNKLHHRLSKEGFLTAFLENRRKPILAFVKALEKSSAFDESSSPPADDGNEYWIGKEHVRVKAQTKSRRDKDHRPRKPPSRKRTMSVEDKSRKAQRCTERRFVRFSDPQTVFGSNEDCDALAKLLKEGSSQPPSLRDKIRHIYLKLCQQYEPRSKAILSQGPRQTRNTKNEYRALTYEVEKWVIEELDNLNLSANSELRELRKMIINKAQTLLSDLDAANDRDN